jgi:chorismate mutase
MPVRGIRGAISIEADQPELILEATRELLEAILQANPGLTPDEIASITFTLTPDLRSVHPALAARQMDWGQVPLLCGLEIAVPDRLPKVLRVLIHWNTDLPQAGIRHMYLRKAIVLRPDLVSSN